MYQGGAIEQLNIDYVDILLLISILVCIIITRICEVIFRIIMTHIYEIVVVMRFKLDDYIQIWMSMCS